MGKKKQRAHQVSKGGRSVNRSVTKKTRDYMKSAERMSNQLSALRGKNVMLTVPILIQMKPTKGLFINANTVWRSQGRRLLTSLVF